MEGRVGVEVDAAVPPQGAAAAAHHRGSRAAPSRGVPTAGLSVPGGRARSARLACVNRCLKSSWIDSEHPVKRQRVIRVVQEDALENAGTLVIEQCGDISGWSAELENACVGSNESC